MLRVSRVKKLSRFFGETFRNLGVGVIVGAMILNISSGIPKDTLVYFALIGVVFVLLGAILYLYGE